MKTLATTTLSLAAFLSSGCTTLAIMQEKQEFPRDTAAVIIKGTEYLINPIKCAEIRSISEDGELDCYAEDGTQSAPVTPAFDLQIDIVEENWGSWGSPAHQAFLLDYFHKGGMERNAEAIAQKLMATYQITQSMVDTIEASEQMEEDQIKMELEGIGAYFEGGASAYEIHRTRMIQWHLENASYFTNKLSESPY